MTKQQLLQSTIDYYSEDINRRCVSGEFGSCFYSPKRAEKEGISEGCAIGRHLSPELQVKLDRSIGDGAGTGVSNMTEKNFNLLPDWMQILGRDFLKRIQNLHDNGNNWDGNGVSVSGKFYIERMIEDFSLNPIVYS